jgi:hypothetical protein
MDDALATVQAISEQLEMPMLETLLYIGDHQYEFSLLELSHYFIVMAGFKQLFTPKEIA